MRHMFLLDHFAEAQNLIIDRVEAELADGLKRTHWMWFVFPQLAGLGQSEMSRRYAIASIDEASAYLRHPLLGPRLVKCTARVNAIEGRSANDIFGLLDDMKFHSCMSLFNRVHGSASEFSTALDKDFAGTADATTLLLLDS